jgi:hypothetical protein
MTTKLSAWGQKAHNAFQACWMAALHNMQKNGEPQVIRIVLDPKTTAFLTRVQEVNAEDKEAITSLHERLNQDHYHTDELLREHGLLVKQVGNDPQTAEYCLVDWQSYRKASAKRIRAYERAALVTDIKKSTVYAKTPAMLKSLMDGTKR